MATNGSDEIIEKVRKLLALGQSDNEHEAALAIARAQALMEKYGIEAAMLRVNGDDDEPVEDFAVFTRSRQKIFWRGKLAATLAKANGCRMYWHRDGYGKSKRVHIRVVGRKTDADWVQQLFTHCALEIDRLTARHATSREFGRSFRFGCVAAIATAIREEKERLRDELRADAERRGRVANLEKALVVVDGRGASAAAWMKEHLRLRSGGGPSGGLDAAGYAAGRAAGSDIYGRAARKRVEA